MCMIEIILLNQSKLSLLGVIRQIPLHAQFRVTLFDNFNDIFTFTIKYFKILFYNKILFYKCQVFLIDEIVEQCEHKSQH